MKAGPAGAGALTAVFRSVAGPCCPQVKPAKSDPTEGAPQEPRRPRVKGSRWPTTERPQYNPNRFFMKPLRLLTATALLVAAFRPALAADAVFPLGVRVGLTPLVGLSVSKTFPGFESEDHSVKVLVTELPSDAYNEVKNAFTANPTTTTGAKPESIETTAGPAFYTIE